MSAPRAQTLQQRMGFMDQDLTTPGHDAIMLWLDEMVGTQLQSWLKHETWPPIEGHSPEQLLTEAWDAYLARIDAYVEGKHRETQQVIEKIADMFPSPPEPDPQEYRHPFGALETEWQRYQRFQGYLGEKVEAAQKAERYREEIQQQAQQPREIPQVPSFEIERKQWEYPVVTGRDFTVGFMDMRVCYKLPSLEFVSTDPPKYKVWWTYASVYFEVKTKIPSLGELLRQAQMYLTHLRSEPIKPRLFIVSPDTRFAEKIREQGFGFIASPSV